MSSMGFLWMWQWSGYIAWIGLAQDRDRWQTLVSAVMNLWVPWNAGSFFTSCKTVSFSRRTLHVGVSKYDSAYSRSMLAIPLSNMIPNSEMSEKIAWEIFHRLYGSWYWVLMGCYVHNIWRVRELMVSGEYIRILVLFFTILFQVSAS